MGIIGKARKIAAAWLGIKAEDYTAPIADADRGRLAALEVYKAWYSGDARALSDVYAGEIDTDGGAFWAARGSTGVSFRKIHGGLPALIVNTLADIVCNDLQGININAEDGGARGAVWDATAEENGFERLLKRAVKGALALGDGAFKISVDTTVSCIPIIEFFPADRVSFTYLRGRIREVAFTTAIALPGGEGVLWEVYGYGYIRNYIEDANGGRHEVCEYAGLGGLEWLSGVADAAFDDDLIMAVPVMFDESASFDGRGRSLFEGKTGAFDALDEVISQWVDALRDGRAKTYIPSGLIPRDPYTGAALKPNGFDLRFVSTASDMAEGADNRIEVVQADIPTEALAESYAAFLDICLQGIIAPCTLGIDLKKTDNAEAQREKTTATLYSRERIVGRLRTIIARVVKTALAVWEMCAGEDRLDTDISVAFGEYGSPSFEKQVEVLGSAVGAGIMSVWAAVNEMYGDTWTEGEKAAEVGRINRRLS